MPDSKPNILLIMTDQQRGDCLGIDGHPCLMTPSMDALAAQGVRFRRAYSTCPICIPARRSLMSGMHPAHHGMVGYMDGQPWNPPATLPQLLRDAGYHTGLVGRNMHLSPPRKRYGFEEMVIAGWSFDSDYVEYMKRACPDGGGYYGTGVMNNDWTARTWHLPEPLHQTHWTVNEALRFFRRRDPERPFFLTVSFLAPHPPLIPPEFYFQRYLRADLPDPIIGDWAEKPKFPDGAPQPNSNRVDLHGQALQDCRAAYYGQINYIDDQIRRILAPEARIVDLKNTWVLFTADHGEMLGDHYFFRKSLPYEGAARIPFIIRPPTGFGASGQINDLPVCLEDIMPTLLDIAQSPIPDHIDGRSLLPTLRGEPQPSWRPWTHIEHSGAIYGFHALTDGRDKYIWFSQSGREQLFDLQDDPQELHDLAPAPEHASRLETWRKRLIERLDKRPEGFVVNGQLKAGRRHSTLVPSA